MRKLLIISLLLLVFAAQFGYYYIYSYQQSCIQEQVKEQLITELPDHLLKLVVKEDNINAISWKEDGKEFYLDGAMYDVARVKHVNGKTYLYCLNDKKEKSLLDDLVKVVNSTDQNNGKTAKYSVKFELPDYLTAWPHKLLHTSLPVQQFDFVTADALLWSAKEVAGPPPRA